MGSQTSDPSAQHVLDSIRRIVQALRESARALEVRHGVSGAQLLVLQKLLEEGDASITGLARRTLTHPSSVSVVVARLEEALLVRRQPSERDRRVVHVSLTARGKALASRAPDPVQLRLLEAVQSLPASKRRQLSLALDQVVREMNLSASTPAPMFFEEHKP